LADEVNQFEQQHADYQQMYNQGGHFKEQLEAIAHRVGRLERSGPVESVVDQITEVPLVPEIERASEVAGYIEIVEKEAELTNPVHDDYTNKVLLASSVNQNPVINLPLTAGQIEEGKKHKVWEAISWLAIWCLRQVRMYPGKVKYKA
jgi:hypothetical protein